MAEAMLRNNSRDMLREMRKVTSSRTSTAGRIDGAVSDAAIAGVFADKASSLFNSVSFNRDSMDALLRSLNSEIQERCIQGESCYHPHSFSVHDVELALKHMK